MVGEPVQVLLIEDNDDHAELITRQLADHRIANRIFRLSDGQEALDFLFQKGKYVNSSSNEKPHVVFLDLRLPKVDGLEATRQMCSRMPAGQRPRVIAMTANAMQGDREMCLEAGMDDYVSKPVRVNELVAALSQCHRIEER